MKRRSAYSLPPVAPGPAPACRNSHQVPNTPPCQLVGAARLALAPALATRAPEAGCQVWGWGRAFRRAGGLLGRLTISYGPNDQVDRVAAPAAAGNNRWLQSSKSVEVTCSVVVYQKSETCRAATAAIRNLHSHVALKWLLKLLRRSACPPF